MQVDDVNVRILVQLWRVAEASRRRLEAGLDVRTAAECTLKQFIILQIIETSFENVRTTDLAVLLACSKANVTQVTGDLVGRGWLVTIPTFADARSSLFRVTDAGRRVYQAFLGELVDETKTQLECLDVEEKQRLATIFKKLTLAWKKTR